MLCRFAELAGKHFKDALAFFAIAEMLLLDVG
jgi:hypothetical protein